MTAEAVRAKIISQRGLDLRLLLAREAAHLRLDFCLAWSTRPRAVGLETDYWNGDRHSEHRPGGPEISSRRADPPNTDEQSIHPNVDTDVAPKILLLLQTFLSQGAKLFVIHAVNQSYLCVHYSLRSWSYTALAERIARSMPKKLSGLSPKPSPAIQTPDTSGCRQ